MARYSARRFIDDFTRPPEALVIPSRALKSVTSKSGKGVYASSDTLYKGATFGRDSLDVAEDLIRIRPKLVRNILLTLARLQGTEVDAVREEEPGKIIHEYRSVVVDGKQIDEKSMAIFRMLSAKWGGNEQEMSYYGSVDATPHFIRTLGAYCLYHGNNILDELVTQKNGELVTVRQTASKAAKWVINKITDSQTGLIEYQRLNPHGIENQVWKDSAEFYVHENGEQANHDAPISSIEVQGLAYDGLKTAARLEPEKNEVLTRSAIRLRDETISLLWQENRGYFALGTDFSPEGPMRIIDTKTANPAALLDTEFFDELPQQQRQKYITGIIRTVMSDDFLTDAGIRSRALSEGHLVKFWDYHGSYVSWPKETYDIAKGMHRQGFPRLAKQLENRILNIYLKNKEYPEFIYVDGRGRVLSSTPSTHSHGDIVVVEGANKPERVQAWTVSAVIAIINKRLNDKARRSTGRRLREVRQDEWQRNLESEIMSQIHHVNLYINPFKLSARYPTYKYHLSTRNTEQQ